MLMKFLTFGIWPALPLSGYFILNYYLQAIINSNQLIRSISFISLVTAIGIIIWSIPMLISAVTGIFQAKFFGALGWFITFICLIKIFKSKDWFRRLKFKICKWDLILIIGLIFAAYLYLVFPSENIYLTRDEALYTNHGIFISRSGRINVPYPWSENLKNIFFRGFKEPPGLFKTEKNMAVQFAHLFPLWLGQAFSTFGYPGLTKLNGIFSILSLFIFYNFCCLFMRREYAVLSTLFLALNPGQLWISRTTLTEILTQLFIFTGLLIFLIAQRNQSKRLALCAGIFLGFSTMVRIDNFLLIPLAIVSFIFFKKLGNNSKEGNNIWKFLFIGMISTNSFALGYYIFFSNPYFLALIPQLKYILFFTLLCFLLFLLSNRSFFNKIYQILFGHTLFLIFIGIILLFLLIYGYYIRPSLEPYSLFNNPEHFLHGTRDYRENSLLNLSKYISPMVIILGIMGLYLSIWNIFTKKTEESTFIILMFFWVGFSLLYCWNPQISPFHFWAVRRFIPIIIPGFIFFSGIFFSIITNRFFKQIFFLKKSVFLAIFILFTIFIYKANGLILFFQENKDSYLQFKEFSEKLPKDELILANGLHSWITPLYLSFDRKVVPLDFSIREGAFALYRYTAKKLKTGKEVFLLLDEHINIPGLDLKHIDKIILKRKYIEDTVNPLPKKIISEEREIKIYKIMKLDQIFFQNLSNDNELLYTIAQQLLNRDLGCEKVLGTNEEGFYGQEFDNEGKPFRWTNGKGRLEIRLLKNKDRFPKLIYLEGKAKEGVEKKLKVIANSREIFNNEISDNNKLSKYLTLSDVPMVEGGKLFLDIISDIHIPKELGINNDERKLGVMITSVKFLDKIPNLINVEIGGKRFLVSNESGFYEEEYFDGKSFRWTNGAGNIELFLNEREIPKFIYIEIDPSMEVSKKLKIFINNQKLFDGILGDMPFSKIFSLSGVRFDQKIKLDILSDVHIPCEIFKHSKDNRKLGVMIRSIKLLDKLPDLINKEIGNSRIFGINESGFYGPESDGSNSFRWTDGHGRLELFIDKGKIPNSINVNIGSTGGVGEKNFKLLINGFSVYEGKIPDGGWNETFNLSEIPIKNKIVIELLSDTHIPEKVFKNSMDRRTLGVMIKGIKLLK
ncbi:MAG: glycosyltransferase family 39 protein [Candidatus Omnitrophica bacterium]|nr:glycosyltransferase family 39 protein [Candidatus Omnitrophota bacterium]